MVLFCFLNVDIAMSHDLYGGLLSLPEEGNIGQQHMQSVNHIFERFSRELRALDDSPLFITSLQVRQRFDL